MTSTTWILVTHAPRWVMSLQTPIYILVDISCNFIYSVGRTSGPIPGNKNSSAMPGQPQVGNERGATSDIK